jgi:hypothetical protein
MQITSTIRFNLTPDWQSPRKQTTNVGEDAGGKETLRLLVGM